MIVKVELSNAEIAAYAIYNLGGVDRKIHTEEVAIECFKLAPDRFSWRLPKYKNYPDKQRAREAIKDAVYFKDGGLVTGRGGEASVGKEVDGWMLTPLGAKWILENLNRINSLLNMISQTSRRLDIQRIIRWFKQENNYQKYIKEGNLDKVSEYDFRDMLLCRPDAPSIIIQKEFKQLCTKAEITQDLDILAFTKSCCDKFDYLLNPSQE